MGVLLALLITAQAADCGVTAHRLSSGAYVEANRLLPQNPVAICALKGGMTVTLAVPAWTIRKTHPKLSKVLVAVGIVTAGSAAVWNATR